MSYSSIAIRRKCDCCGRSIAVVAGRLARHDPGKPASRLRPADRTRILVSCVGSLRPAPILDAPAKDGTQSVFDFLDGIALVDPNDLLPDKALQGALFEQAA
jgi:hypothetical protein